MAYFSGNSFNKTVSSSAQVCFSKMLSCVNEKTCSILTRELVRLIEEATHRVSKDDNTGEFVLQSPEILNNIEGIAFILKSEACSY